MNEHVRTIPEFYYDLLALAIPGTLSLGLLVSSPASASTGLAGYLETLTLIERILLIVLGGYVFGHILTSLSDFALRRPSWLLFGEPSRTLLGIDAGRRPLLTVIPKPFDAPLAEAIRLEMQAVLPTFGGHPDAHSLLDVCEQHIKRLDREAGLLCQKRHGTVVLCRNMAVGVSLCLPCYWVLGSGAQLILAFSALTLAHRWNYLRVRRAQFLYHTFHVVAQQYALGAKIRAKAAAEGVAPLSE